MVLDTDAKRAKFAKDKMGLESLQLKGDKPDDGLRKPPGGALPDVTIDAVGSIDGFKTALRCVRDGGRVVVLGSTTGALRDADGHESGYAVSNLRFAGMANVHAHWNDALLIRSGRARSTPAPRSPTGFPWTRPSKATNSSAPAKP